MDSGGFVFNQILKDPHPDELKVAYTLGIGDFLQLIDYFIIQHSRLVGNKYHDIPLSRGKPVRRRDAGKSIATGNHAEGMSGEKKLIPSDTHQIKQVDIFEMPVTAH